MKYKKGNKVLTIEQDEYSESPREWDNLGIMVCKHKNYNLGDSVDYEIYIDRNMNDLSYRAIGDKHGLSYEAIRKGW